MDETDADRRYVEILAEIAPLVGPLLADLDNVVGERLSEHVRLGRRGALGDLRELFAEIGVAGDAQVSDEVAELLDLTKQAVQIAERVVNKTRAEMTALKASMTEEVVTKRLRVVDDDGRTWVDASISTEHGVGRLRCQLPDDPKTYAEIAAHARPGPSGGRAGVFLVRAGDVVGNLETVSTNLEISGTEPASELWLINAKGGASVHLPKPSRSGGPENDGGR